MINYRYIKIIKISELENRKSFFNGGLLLKFKYQSHHAQAIAYPFGDLQN